MATSIANSRSEIAVGLGDRQVEAEFLGSEPPQDRDRKRTGAGAWARRQGRIPALFQPGAARWSLPLRRKYHESQRMRDPGCPDRRSWRNTAGCSPHHGQTTTRPPLHRLYRARIGAGNDGERIALIGLRAEHVHDVNRNGDISSSRPVTREPHSGTDRPSGSRSGSHAEAQAQAHRLHAARAPPRPRRTPARLRVPKRAAG